MSSIVFGLIAAITWGAADFAGGLASRKSNPYQVVTFTWLLGLVIMPVLALISREPMMPLSGWLWCAAAGAFGIIGILLLYQSLTEGAMSISISVSAVIAAALPVFAGLFLEGTPKLARLLGFGLALLAVWLVSWGDGKGDRLRMRLLWKPLLAGVGFGCYFILVNLGSQEHVFWPMVATRILGALMMLVYMTAGKRSIAPPKHVIPLVLLNFVSDSIGTISFILAGQSGRMDVASVLGSLYPGITILLAGWLLHEHLKLMQWVGVGLALGAIALLSI